MAKEVERQHGSATFAPPFGHFCRPILTKRRNGSDAAVANPNRDEAAHAKHRAEKGAIKKAGKFCFFVFFS